VLPSRAARRRSTPGIARRGIARECSDGTPQRMERLDGSCAESAPEPAWPVLQTTSGPRYCAGPAIVFLAPMKDEVVPGRYAVLAMTLNLRVCIVTGSLVLVLVGLRAAAAQRDSAAFPRAPHAITWWIETSCLVPSRYALHAMMRGAPGQGGHGGSARDCATGAERLGRTLCCVLSADTDRSPPPFPATLHP
jgi:hypothetical protein